jgi:hypothetical protein
VAEDVGGAVLGLVETDGGDEVDEFAEADGAHALATVFLVEEIFEAGIFALDGDHGGVDALDDIGGLGVGGEVSPAGFGGDPKDVVGGVVVSVLEFDGEVGGGGAAHAKVVVVGGVAKAVSQLGAVLLERSRRYT